MRDLLDIIMRHASRKFSHAVLIDDLHSAIPKKLRKSFFLDAYAIAGRECIRQVNQWAEAERITNPIEFVFEDGDEHKGSLRKLIQRINSAFSIANRYHNAQLGSELNATSIMPEPIFRPKKDIQSKSSLVPGFIPLQAADLLANELFQTAKEIPKRMSGEPANSYEPRFPLKVLNSMPRYLGTFVVADGLNNLRKGLDGVPENLAFLDRMLEIKAKGRE